MGNINTKSTEKSAKVHLDTVKVSMLLAKKSMTQKKLAETIGVTEASMSRYMHKGRTPRIETLHAMAEILGTTVSELICRGEHGLYGKMRVILDDGAFIPRRAHLNDAGMDVMSPVDAVIPAGGSVVIDTGVHVEIMDGYVGLLKSKSGLNVNHDITSEGVIDAGYQGSIRVKLYNHGKKDYTVRREDKISQLVVTPVWLGDVEVVDHFDTETERGTGGFGSTGR